ncbi:TPA: hypothetical protein DIC40_04715 [Patescibacteria group bacterium]|nr:hypothetical protein [Candidatus Gracilibacteria bacterium]
MKQVNKPENRELKGYIMLMMYRTDLQLISKVTIPVTTINVISTLPVTTETQSNNTQEPTTTNSEPTPQTTQTTTTTPLDISSTTNTQSITRTDTEQTFINKINKNYQFTIGFKKDASDVSIKYLQYFLKSKGFYQGIINGTNTESTIKALFEWQKANNVLTDATDPAA